MSRKAYKVVFIIYQDVDGQAFLLLTLRDCMEYLGIKLGPALKICSLIQELKIAFLSRYVVVMFRALLLTNLNIDVVIRCVQFQVFVTTWANINGIFATGHN